MITLFLCHFLTLLIIFSLDDNEERRSFPVPVRIVLCVVVLFVFGRLMLREYGGIDQISVIQNMKNAVRSAFFSASEMEAPASAAPVPAPVVSDPASAPTSGPLSVP